MIPTLIQAVQFLSEASQMNPGPWVAHSLYVAQAAQLIAARHPGLADEKAYILGLLHDIGRREGIFGNRHTMDGYRFLADQGFTAAARICLTHSCPTKDIHSLAGQWDCSLEDQYWIQAIIDSLEYDDYDRLVILCDSLALPLGFCIVEKRLVDVALRYGFNDYTLAKWKAILQIKKDFETVLGVSIYTLLPGVVENIYA